MGVSKERDGPGTPAWTSPAGWAMVTRTACMVMVMVMTAAWTSPAGWAMVTRTACMVMVMVMTAAWIIPAGWATVTRTACMVMVMVMVMTAAWIIPAGWATATRIACMATTRHPAGGTTHGRKEIPLYPLDQYGPASVAHGPPLSGTTHSTTGHPQVGGTIFPGLPRCGGRGNRGRQICPVSLYLCHPCLAPVSLALGPPGPCLVPGGTTMTCHLQVGGTTTHGIHHGGPSGRREICPVT